MGMDKIDRRGLFGVGALLAGAGVAASAPGFAQAGASAAGAHSANEALDAWMDRPAARHCLVLDTTTPGAAGEGAGYALNFIHANETGYGLKPQDLGVILVLRHMSTPYGYGDATWKKYGKAFAQVMKLDEKEAAKAEAGNPLLANSDEPVEKGFEWAAGPPLTNLVGKGGMFAVCAMATAFIAAKLAKNSGGDAAAIEAELKADLIPGAHLVPAGIVAVGRAQERGYAFAYVA